MVAFFSVVFPFSGVFSLQIPALLPCCFAFAPFLVGRFPFTGVSAVFIMVVWLQFYVVCSGIFTCTKNVTHLWFFPLDQTSNSDFHKDCMNSHIKPFKFI